MMRTTLTIDDDLLRAAKEYAKNENITLGQAVSYFMRKGLRPNRSPEYPVNPNGLPVFRVSESARPLTSEDVKRGLEDDA